MLQQLLDMHSCVFLPQIRHLCLNLADPGAPIGRRDRRCWALALGIVFMHEEESLSWYEFWGCPM